MLSIFKNTISADSARAVLDKRLGANHGIYVVKGTAGEGHEFDRDTQTLSVDLRRTGKMPAAELEILAACLRDVVPKVADRCQLFEGSAGGRRIERFTCAMARAVAETHQKKLLEIDSLIDVPRIERSLAMAIGSVHEDYRDFLREIRGIEGQLAVALTLSMSHAVDSVKHADHRLAYKNGQIL